MPDMLAPAATSPLSGASSHVTQTGRPSLWTDSDQRKLGRLYLYTTLPIKKILQIISPNGGPGKDSANKKLNAMLNKEPRWLRPRSSTEIERRMNELGRSPTRARPAEPAPWTRSPQQQAPQEQTPLSSTYTFQQPLLCVDPNAMVLDPPVIAEPTHYADDGHLDFNGALCAPLLRQPTPSHGGRLYNPEALPPAAPSPSPGLFFSLRRPTFMSTSTDVSTGSMQTVLSGYSAGFRRHVKRVVKRYTLPINTTPVRETDAEAGPSFGGTSSRGSWVHDECAPAALSTAPPLPGDFLNIAALLARQGACQGSFPEHETRSCLCWVRSEITASRWMAENGAASDETHQLLQNLKLGLFGAIALSDYDVFGNSPLHLLAAVDASHEHIVQLVLAQPNQYGRRNSAGQTFLHLLSPTWLSEGIGETSNLRALLQAVRHDAEFLYAQDHYGRTFLHVLRSKVEEVTNFNYLLQFLGCTLRRDAFGSMPTCTEDVVFHPPRRAFTTVMSEDDMSADYASPSQPPLNITDQTLTTQARLIASVHHARENPTAEDRHGRNGLQCLASVFLSEETLLAKIGGATNGAPAATDSARKSTMLKRSRSKRESSPPPGKQSEASAERLKLRETIVHNLIQSGVQVNHYDNDGNTVLASFVAQLPEEDDHRMPVAIIKDLIQAGANVHARNRLGETALHVAVRRGRKLAMRTLVEAGASVYVRDASGRSVLDVADAKTTADIDNYMHYEACRAWLSGSPHAVQDPSLVDEWGVGKGVSRESSQSKRQR